MKRAFFAALVLSVAIFALSPLSLGVITGLQCIDVAGTDGGCELGNPDGVPGNYGCHNDPDHPGQCKEPPSQTQKMCKSTDTNGYTICITGTATDQCPPDGGSLTDLPCGDEYEYQCIYDAAEGCHMDPDTIGKDGNKCSVKKCG
jgi:hypothetical protein